MTSSSRKVTIILSIILGIVILSLLVAVLIYFDKVRFYHTSLSKEKAEAWGIKEYSAWQIDITPTTKVPYHFLSCGIYSYDYFIPRCSIQEVLENSTEFKGPSKT